ncbi:MAG TPA: lactate racemase domain-containing protein [Ktedonobacteraceae bacterium]|nr:lactate racemase domain-containing protein [Ktedonobacteraceae bacterium]
MVLSKGSLNAILTDEDVDQLLGEACAQLEVTEKRVLVIIPDGTRTSPLPLMFRLLDKHLGQRARQLDYLVALGTHQPMSAEALSQLVGAPVNEEGAVEGYPRTRVFNHHWSDPQALQTIGVIGREEAAEITGNLLADDVPVTLNRLIFAYDQLIICGPVFPHEVAGFSGGAKYLFPGIAGAEIINFTHWLGALVTNIQTIGVKQTPVRRVIQRAAEFVTQPLFCIAMVLRGSDLHGVYCGSQSEAWSQAADLSGQLNIVHTGKAMRSVLAMPSPMYDDLWTAGKAMYKTEGTIADGGEVIIYAPHLDEISYTHGRLLDQIGYHVRDYFTKQWERFEHVPGGVLAHSTHVKGLGSYDAANGVESPRIQVTLATSIPEARCRLVNLGYRDYRTIDPHAWENREDEGYLLVPHAGEVLYRI